MTEIDGYHAAKRIACYWARVALTNKRDGLDWKIAAREAHTALRFALMVIAA